MSGSGDRPMQGNVRTDRPLYGPDPLAVASHTLGAANERADDAEAQCDDLRRMLADTEHKLRQVCAERDALQQRVTDLAALVRDLERDLREARDELRASL